MSPAVVLLATGIASWQAWGDAAETLERLSSVDAGAFDADAFDALEPELTLEPESVDGADAELPLAADALDAWDPALSFEEGSDAAEENGWGDGAAADRAVYDAWSADPLDLNAATVEELEELPGINAELAEQVRRARPFTRASDLLDVDTLPEGLAAALLPFVFVRGDGGRAGQDLAAEAGGPDHAAGWRAAVGATWPGGGAPAPFLQLSGPGEQAWAVRALASVLPSQVGTLGVRAAPLRAAQSGDRWGDDWSLGTARLQLQSVHLRGDWGHLHAVLGDYTAGFAEGLTLERSPRRALTGWTLRAPPRYLLPRARWSTPGGWQGAAVSWASPDLTLTALTGLAPRPWGGAAAQVRLMEGLQLTGVGYGTAAPDLPAASAGRPSGAQGWQRSPASGRGPQRAWQRSSASSRGPLPPSRGALGLGLRARRGNWQLAGEGSRGFPAGWAWHLGSRWQAAPPLQLALRWRGGTADFRNAYRRGGLRAPWTSRAGTQAQAHLRAGAWDSLTRVDVDRPRWRVAEGVGWRPTRWEQLRLGGTLWGLSSSVSESARGRPTSRQAEAEHASLSTLSDLELAASSSVGGSPPALSYVGELAPCASAGGVRTTSSGAEAPLSWSLHALASSQRLRTWPCSLALRASARAVRTTARVRWRPVENTAWGMALTAATPLPRPQQLEAALLLDVQHMWDRWELVARGWSGRGKTWEHAILLLLGART